MGIETHESERLTLGHEACLGLLERRQGSGETLGNLRAIDDFSEELTVLATILSAGRRFAGVGFLIVFANAPGEVWAQAGSVLWGNAGEPTVACTTTGGTTGPVVTDGVTVTTSWSETAGLVGAGSALTNAGCAAGNNFATDNGNVIGGQSNTFIMGMDATTDNNSQFMELTMTFSPAITNATFLLLDADIQRDSTSPFSEWTDLVLVEALDSAMTPAFVLPTSITFNPTTPTATTSTVCPGYVATNNRCIIGQTGNSTPNSATFGNVTITYGSGDIASIRVRYFASAVPESNDPVGQWMGFGVASWTGSLPVVITSVDSEVGRGTTRVAWTTATETANAGFRILAREDGRWTPMATVPSQAPDSKAEQDYEVVLPGEHSEVMIEDLDLRSRPQRHGPFVVGRRYGEGPKPPKQIDWVGIKQASGLAGPLDRVRRTAALARAPAARPFSDSARKGGSGSAVREARLLVAEAGIQRVSYEVLHAAGIDLGGVRAKDIAVVDAGRGVNRHVGGGDVFGAGSWIEFFAKPQVSLWSPVDVYTLVVNSGLAKQAKTEKPAKRAAPATVAGAFDHRVDSQYSFASPTEDPFYEEGLLGRPSAPARLSRTFDLDDLASAEGAVLGVEAWGSTDFPSADDHHVKWFLNGVEVGDHRFDGITPFRAEYDVSGLLQPTANLLELEVVGDTGNPWDLVNFEAFEVRYQRRSAALGGSFRGATADGPYLVEGFSGGEVVGWLDDGKKPSRLEVGLAASVAVPRGKRGDEVWLVESGGEKTPGIEAGIPSPRTRSKAEYIIVAHPDLVETAAGLAALEESRGLSTEVVSTEEIYAAYSDHQETPEAIFQFLARSARQRRLRYVALAGGTSYDPYDHLGLGSVSLVPTAYVEVGIVRYTPSDEPLVDFDADGFADVPIGRLPARTSQELESVIAKQWAWQPSPTALLTSGNFDGSGQLVALNHTYSSGLPGWGTAQSDVDSVGRDAVRAAILGAFGPSGPSTVSFVGHSSYGIWDFSPLLHWSDVAAFSNAGRPLLVTQWSCWNAYFAAPDIEDMSTHLLLEPGVGAAAVIGASTLTETSSHQALGDRFFLEVGTGAGTVGDALLRAKRRLVEVGAPLDAVYGMVLLGDPAMPLSPQQAPLPPPGGPPGGGGSPKSGDVD